MIEFKSSSDNVMTTTEELSDTVLLLVKNCAIFMLDKAIFCTESVDTSTVSLKYKERVPWLRSNSKLSKCGGIVSGVYVETCFAFTDVIG